MNGQWLKLDLKVENLFASRKGQIELAIELNKILDDIEADRKVRSSIREGLSRPNDIKRFAVLALRESNRYGFAPPSQMIDLVERLLEAAPDDNRREKGKRKNQKLFNTAARVQSESEKPLSTRALAAELRRLGFDAKDRTIASYVADPDFQARVKIAAAQRKT